MCLCLSDCCAVISEAGYGLYEDTHRLVLQVCFQSSSMHNCVHSLSQKETYIYIRAFSKAVCVCMTEQETVSELMQLTTVKARGCCQSVLSEGQVVY